MAGFATVNLQKKTEKKGKKKKKESFLKGRLRKGRQGFCNKKYNPDGWRFFLQNPKGLTLTDLCVWACVAALTLLCFLFFELAEQHFTIA